MLIGLSGCGGIFTDEVLTEVGNGSPVIITNQIRKKVQFQKCKKTLFAFSKMTKNQFLHQKKF